MIKQASIDLLVSMLSFGGRNKKADTKHLTQIVQRLSEADIRYLRKAIGGRLHVERARLHSHPLSFWVSEHHYTDTPEGVFCWGKISLGEEEVGTFSESHGTALIPTFADAGMQELFLTASRQANYDTVSNYMETLLKQAEDLEKS